MNISQLKESRSEYTLIFYCKANFSVGFSLNGKTEYNYVRSLNLNKVSKKYSHVTSSSFSQHVPGLSNLCTFVLVDGMAGKFISRY